MSAGPASPPATSGDDERLGIELSACGPGSYEARGKLTFATARRARALGLEAFRAPGLASIAVDLSGITAADSAGLAVLLDWLAFARQADRHLRFATLPPQAQAIARISDVQEMLERGV